MLRNTIKKLIEWKIDAYRKPLLIRGARQVGKTHLVEQFAKSHFPTSFIKIDFEARPDLKKLFSGSLEPEAIIPQLELVAESSISDEKTLLFFDEIQACPQALLSLRYFYEQRPKLHLIAAGSLLEFALKEISFPVGRINSLNVYPMNFDEFLSACGKERLAELITSKPRTLSTTEHELALSEYVKFSYVGGLPEAVKVFSETQSLQRTALVQRELSNMYQADFSKYAGRASIECIRQVFQSAPSKLTKPLKYSHLTQEFSVPTIKNAVDLLRMAQVITKIPNINPHGLPLGASASQKMFKILMCDVGMLHGISALTPTIPFNQSTLLDAYSGALSEQLVGQVLVEQTDGDLYTWYRSDPGAQAEVDFVLSKNDKILPIEVKAGAPGRLKSMHQFLRQYPMAPRGYVISTAPYQEVKESRLTLLPIYYSGNFLKWE